MNVEQKMSICNDCENFETYCFCYCPYCGEDKYKDCNCSLKISEDYDQILSNNKEHVEKLFKDELFRDYYKDWWRLEKWQFGRKNFS